MTQRSVMLAYLGFGLTILHVPQTISYGVAYSFTFGHFGGSAPYVFSLSGTLPTGITFTDNGDGTATLAGTSTDPGAFPVTVTLSDGNRNRVANSYTLQVVALPLSLSGHLPDQTIGVAITPYTYTTSGGYGGYSYAITSGALPTGLSLNGATGQVTGTPTANGSYSWTVTVTDSNGGTFGLPDSCAVSAASMTLTGTATSPVVVGSAYSWTPTTTGGTGPYTYSIGSGSLPAGTTLNTSTGAVSGTVSAIASYTFVIHVVDSASATANSSSQTVIVNADATALSIYNKIANAAGGHGAYWDLDETTTLSGPTSLRADDANGNNLGLSGAGSQTIVNGPRGSGDVATQGTGGGYLLAPARTIDDDLDVPASAQKYCLFGWMKFNSTGLFGVGGTYQGGSQPNGGCMFFEGIPSNGYLSGYSGDTVSGLWCHADLLIPDTTNWHFWVAWRDNTDGKMRLSLDAGTPATSSNTCVAPQSTIPFGIFIGYGAPDFAASRWGYIKGDYLTGTEQTWMVNGGNGRNWAEIKALAGH